jgi:hypothetical protein
LAVDSQVSNLVHVQRALVGTEDRPIEISGESDKGPGGARRKRVDPPCYERLAAPWLARDQDRAESVAAAARTKRSTFCQAPLWPTASSSPKPLTVSCTL